MHGIIAAELEAYAGHRSGPQAWERATAAVPALRRPDPLAVYADEDVLAVLGVLAQELGLEQDALLGDFGTWLVPDLLAVYGSLLDPRWRTLDVVERTEQIVHAAVRLQQPGATPPALRTRRDGAGVIVTYGSSRRMCALAKGLVRGIARHFGEQVVLLEPRCMQHGAAVCELHVRLVEPAP